MSYVLVSENLNPGGGKNWSKYFKDPAEAKRYAGKDYNGGKVKWRTMLGGTGWITPDLGYVRYYIAEIVFEDEPVEPRKPKRRELSGKDPGKYYGYHPQFKG